MVEKRDGGLRWAAVVAWALALAAVLLWPITESGYLLGHDMVFTPRQPLGAGSVGLGSASPRAVPLDALVALAERAVDGEVVGRLALLVPLLMAGIGAALVLRSSALAGRLAACGVAIWNPYVIERLALGQWALLWAYAALPWLIIAISRLNGPGGWFGRTLAVAAASITPTGGLIASCTAVVAVVGLQRPRCEVVGTLSLVAILQLPWVVPSLVSTASATSDPAGVAAFAPRAEHPGGVLLSVLDGGGIWNADVVPGSRSGVLPWLWLALVIAAGACGTARLVNLLGRKLVISLAALAAVGLLLAILPSLPGGGSLVRAVVVHLPGGGLLRDAQKWLQPLLLLEALLIGAAVDRLVTRLRAVQWRVLIAVVALCVPVIALPDAAATLRPTLLPVHYPHDWASVAQRIGAGDTAVLPWGSYRTFSWATSGSVLDPAPRYLPAPAVVDDRLAVSGRLLSGEDPRARVVGAALTDTPGLARRLARLGITWVVVEHGTPGVVPELSELRSVYRGPDLSLYRVPVAITRYPRSTPRTIAVGIVDLLAVAVLAAAGAGAATGQIRRRRKRTSRNFPTLL